MSNWYRRPSERYDREEYYRNSNPDHISSRDEDSRWHFAGKFEDKNDPTYSYGTRDRDMMREYPTYPMNDQQYFERHPRDYSRSSSDKHYDRNFNRSQFGYQSEDLPVDLTKSYAGRGPKGWKRSDESIREQVCQTLEENHSIDAREIEVEVKDGIVTLIGNIHDRPAKRLAENVIEFLPGVLDVHNQLTVDRSFFERAKEFLTGSEETGASETPSKAGKPEGNPRH